MDISVATAEAGFSVRAVAVFIDQGHVLLHRSDADSFWELPCALRHVVEVDGVPSIT